MNQKLYRVLLRRIEPRWFEQKALDLGLLGAGELERFEWRHRHLRQHGVIQMSQLLRFRCSTLSKRRFVNFISRGYGLSAAEDSSAVRRVKRLTDGPEYGFPRSS